MLEPLDPEKLRALVCDDDNLDFLSIRAAKRFFAINEVLEGVRNLLSAFWQFRPLFYHDHKNRKKWHIQFPGPLFDTLYLRANGKSVEIFVYENCVSSREIREYFKHVKCSASLEMIGHPENWVLLLQWLWRYGDEVLAVNVKKGSMLRPLDHYKLETLTEDDNDADCYFIRRTKACLGKEKDLARGIVCLFEGWEIFAPFIHRTKGNETSWQVRFRDSPFRSLKILPGSDYGIVDIFAFDKRIESFHVLDNPDAQDREMWRRLLNFVWDYGRLRRVHKQQWEETQRHSTKKHAKAQPKKKNPEKPLLHKVLHTTTFKAKHEAVSRAKNGKVIPSEEDEVMKDDDTGIHIEESSNRQLLNEKSPLRATDPNAQLRISWKAKNTDDHQAIKAGIDGINIGGLQIMDCHP